MGQSPRHKAFEQEFRKHLDHLTDPLIAELRTLIATKPPAVVKILSFEIQADWRRFPVYAFAMSDQSPDEVYQELPFKGPLLMESGPLVPEGAIDQNAFEEAGVATFESGAKILAEWFGKCWDRASGAKFPLPAYINLHDDSSFYDLKAKKWVEDSDIWP